MSSLFWAINQLVLVSWSTRSQTENCTLWLVLDSCSRALFAISWNLNLSASGHLFWGTLMINHQDWGKQKETLCSDKANSEQSESCSNCSVLASLESFFTPVTVPQLTHPVFIVSDQGLL